MRYVLITNPAAGKRDPSKTVLPPVRHFFLEQGLNPVCYLTREPGEAVKLAAREAGREGPVRIYAIGGDGTLAEVAQGAAGKENAEIGIFPCGTGNDYVRSFAPRQRFLSPKLQVAGASKPVDLIRSELGVSINLCSVGMDARVSLETKRLKRIPFLSGSAAYDLALLKTLAGRIGENLRIRIDGGKEFEGCFLFVLAASGQYYGGGYRGAPKAVPDDGLLDFVLIRKPPPLRIPKLAGMYKAGRHIGAKEFDGILTFRRGTEMEVFADKPVASNRDGEIALVQAASYRVLPHAVRFIVPEERDDLGEFVNNL